MTILSHHHNNAHKQSKRTAGHHHAQSGTKADAQQRRGRRRGPRRDSTIVTLRNIVNPENANKCGKCGSVVEGKSVIVRHRVYHLHCVACNGCGKLLSKSANDKIVEHKGTVYHEQCAVEMLCPKCVLCKKTIRGEHKMSPFWKEAYCTDHIEPTRCCSCKRVIPKGKRKKKIEKGRYACGDCRGKTITKKRHLHSLKKDCVRFLRKMGVNMKITFPICLVDQKTIQKASGVEKTPYHHREVYGKCLSVTTKKKISSVVRLKGHKKGNNHRKPRRRVVYLDSHSSVKAIVLLVGLHRELCGAVLCHELLHAYFRIHQVGHIPPAVEEGICNVAGYLWLIRNVSQQVIADVVVNAGHTRHRPDEAHHRTFLSLFRHGKDQPLALGVEKVKYRRYKDIPPSNRFFINQYDTSNDPIYGDGFRSAMRACFKHGFAQVVHTIRKKKRLPML